MTIQSDFETYRLSVRDEVCKLLDSPFVTMSFNHEHDTVTGYTRSTLEVVRQTSEPRPQDRLPPLELQHEEAYSGKFLRLHTGPMGQTIGPGVVCELGGRHLPAERIEIVADANLGASKVTIFCSPEVIVNGNMSEVVRKVRIDGTVYDCVPEGTVPATLEQTEDEWFDMDVPPQDDKPVLVRIESETVTVQHKYLLAWFWRPDIQSREVGADAHWRDYGDDNRLSVREYMRWKHVV